MSAPLTKLEQETLVHALDAWGECDGYNIDSRRVRTRVLNSLQAKGMIYSVGMDGSRPMKDAGFEAAKAARTALGESADEAGARGHTAVTEAEAVEFLERACRNWSRIPGLSAADIDDVRKELERFINRAIAKARGEVA